MHRALRVRGAGKIWRPASEAEATGNAAAFLEWLRAQGDTRVGDPASLRAWLHRDPDGCAAAVARFAGLEQGLAGRSALTRGNPSRIALIADWRGARRSWTRAQVRSGVHLPGAVHRAIDGLSWPQLCRLALSHLLVIELRPDDRLHWRGPEDDSWPYGAWLVGASVVLGGEADPGARLFAAAPGLDQAASFRSG